MNTTKRVLAVIALAGAALAITGTAQADDSRITDPRIIRLIDEDNVLSGDLSVDPEDVGRVPDVTIEETTRILHSDDNGPVEFIRMIDED
ncbi:hypothetical protein AB0F18_37760 [Streptomyces sp. NPDC029216]|uniref:hypothetical protein n=1 Tax=Streptomyces sp. NPDC029216 TaxID=3154701 RepID=UPI0033E1D89E